MNEPAATIRAELARRDISRGELAAALGVSRNYIWRRLTGRSQLTVTDVQRIAAVLGVEVIDLIGQPKGEQSS